MPRKKPSAPRGNAVLAVQDEALLALLSAGNNWLRAALCTLARRGVAFRQTHPERARAVLDALSTLPFYKGGQFLFDLMEWEDFMLDGPPPAILPNVLDAGSLQRIVGWLNRLRQAIDTGNARAMPEFDFSVTVVDEDLPPLESSFYLYEFVVLGAWMSAAAAASHLKQTQS